jgi:hypothetical protein
MITFKDGFLCPDKYPGIGKEIIEAMLRYIVRDIE